MKKHLITKLYLYALLPNIIAVLGGTINVFFDGILVGQKLGSVGLEAINQSLPVYLFLCTIGSLFASGASYLSSIAFGKNDTQEGRRMLNAALGTTALIGAVVCLGALLLSPVIARILATAETYEYVLTYIRITLVGGVFKILLYIPYFYLRLEGKNKRSSLSMLTMMGLNIGLDYIFLFVLDLGIAGAAWASVIATFVACCMSFCFLYSGHSNFRFGLGLLKKQDWPELTRYGSPMALNNVFSSTRILITNLVLKFMGVSNLVTIFAVINNLYEFSICVQNGVPQTATAMTGILHGERDSAATKRLLNVQLIVGLILSIVLSRVMTFFPTEIAALFGSNVDCNFAINCLALALPFATFNSIMSYYFNATGRIGLANFIVVSRSFALTTVLCIAFSSFGRYIWMYMPAAEILTSVIFLLLSLFMRKKKEVSRFYLLDESFERAGSSISLISDCSPEQINSASIRIGQFCEENEFSPRKTMALSLAIEEILTIIAQKSLSGEGNMDVRVLKSGDEGIVRVRSVGKYYNPFELADDSMDYMGVQMIMKLATNVEYSSALGVNTLIIFV